MQAADQAGVRRTAMYGKTGNMGYNDDLGKISGFSSGFPPSSPSSFPRLPPSPRNASSSPHQSDSQPAPATPTVNLGWSTTTTSTAATTIALRVSSFVSVTHTPTGPIARLLPRALLVIGCEDGSIRVIDVTKGEEKAVAFTSMFKSAFHAGNSHEYSKTLQKQSKPSSLSTLRPSASPSLHPTSTSISSMSILFTNAASDRPGYLKHAYPPTYALLAASDPDAADGWDIIMSRKPTAEGEERERERARAVMLKSQHEYVVYHCLYSSVCGYQVQYCMFS
jgi:hypothetical protein